MRIGGYLSMQRFNGSVTRVSCRSNQEHRSSSWTLLRLDILASLVGHGPTAFELVCLDDDASQERLNLMGDAAALTRQYHRDLEAAGRAAFDAAFGDAFMMIAFVPTSGKRGVRRALPGLFDALMRLPVGAKGNVFGYGNAPPAGVERVNIARGLEVEGPGFTTSTGGSVGPLNLAKLEEKLG
jgi:hypothetical protein